MSPFWRREESLNARLAREAGLSIAGERVDEPPRVLDPSPQRAGGLFGELAVLHGSARAREWDAVVSARAPGIDGDAVHFLALPDGELVVDEDVPDEALALLAEAVEATLDPPYRAQAVRRGEDTWAVGARRVDVVPIRADLEGDELELSVHDGTRTLSVDGSPSDADLPELEALADGHESYVIRAVRVDGHLWEVELFPL